MPCLAIDVGSFETGILDPRLSDNSSNQVAPTTTDMHHHGEMPLYRIGKNNHGIQAVPAASSIQAWEHNSEPVYAAGEDVFTTESARVAGKTLSSNHDEAPLYGIDDASIFDLLWTQMPN